MSNQTRLARAGSARAVAVAMGVAIAYVIGARLGLSIALVGEQVTPLWPPTGIALFALLRWGWTAAPGIALGALIVNLPIGPSLPGALAIAAGNTAAPAAAFAVLGRLRVRPGLDRLRDAALLVAIGSLAMTLSAGTGSVVLAATGTVPATGFWPTWWVWWTGDAMGVVVVTPLLLAAAVWRRYLALGGRRALELAMVLASSFVVTALVTGQELPLLYLIFPVIMWAGLRFQILGAAPAVAIASTMTVLSASSGGGPIREAGMLGTMITLQAFNAAAALVGLLLSGLMKERDDALRALERAGSELEARVASRTDELSHAVAELTRSEERLEEAQRCAGIGSWDWDIRDGVLTWTEELYRLFGLEPGSGVSFETFVAALHPEDRARVQATIEDAMQDLAPFSFDHRVVWPDGSVHWLHGRGNVVADPTGRPVRMHGTGQDVDERKRAEETERHLAEARTRRRQALELNDEIVQGLSIAAFALEARDGSAARRAVGGSLAAARKMVSDMLEEDADGTLVPGDLVRARPADAPGAQA